MIRLRAWNISLDQGQIITGAQRKYARGEVVQFLPRCTWDTVSHSPAHTRSIVRSRRWRPYRIEAEIIRVTPRVFVIDFGIPAIARRRPAPDDLAAGDFIMGDVTLLIDSVTIATARDDIDDLGPLSQRWEILGITKCTVPLKPVFDQQGVQQYLIADHAHATYESVERTVGRHDAWMTTEQSTVNYRLRCRLLKP